MSFERICSGFRDVLIGPQRDSPPLPQSVEEGDP